MSSIPAVQFHSVSKEYGSREGVTRALQDVDFELASGEFVAVMGPSGSGKTTMLTIAGALQQPTAGSVDILGERITGLSQSALARVRRTQLGFIFQSFNLLSALNARENVEYALRLGGRDSHGARASASELLAMVGLERRAEALPANLSGGEQQRVCIARAVANNARVILADEPTASLDSERAAEIMGLLRAVARDFGVGVLAVTHDLRVHLMADRHLWLEAGQLRSVEAATLPVGSPAAAAGDGNLSL
jgi:putative ABC transport system ATP-binding protein